MVFNVIYCFCAKHSLALNFLLLCVKIYFCYNVGLPSINVILVMKLLMGHNRVVRNHQMCVDP